MKSKGILISLEGGEGSGKSTQARNIQSYFKKKGYKVQIVQEPGQTRIGKKIREILLNPKHKEIHRITEVLLYMAARSQLVAEIIIPALDRGEVIICDRYTDSSMAYQGYARGIGFQTVGRLNEIATQGHVTHITFYFDVDPKIGLMRRHKGSKGKMDRLEKESLLFHQKIRKAYLELVEKEPKRIKVIPAENSTKEIWELVKKELELFLRKK